MTFSRNMYAVIALLLAVFVGGCAYDGPSAAPSEVTVTVVGEDPTKAHYIISDEFSSDEIDAITRAGSAWSEATAGRVELTFEIGPTIPGERSTISTDDVGGGQEGFATPYAVVIGRGLSTKCVWLVAAHELGHTFGIGHGGVLMQHNQTFDCDATITADDVALFDAL